MFWLERERPRSVALSAWFVLVSYVCGSWRVRQSGLVLYVCMFVALTATRYCSDKLAHFFHKKIFSPKTKPHADIYNQKACFWFQEASSPTRHDPTSTTVGSDKSTPSISPLPLPPDPRWYARLFHVSGPAVPPPKKGKDRATVDSPSFYNPVECSKVKRKG